MAIQKKKKNKLNVEIYWETVVQIEVDPNFDTLDTIKSQIFEKAELLFKSNQVAGPMVVQVSSEDKELSKKVEETLLY